MRRVEPAGGNLDAIMPEHALRQCDVGIHGTMSGEDHVGLEERMITRIEAFQLAA